MENQSKRSGNAVQRWFESEAETARGYGGGGSGGCLHPRAKKAGKPGQPVSTRLGKAGLVCLGSQTTVGLWLKFGSSEGPRS